MSSSLNRLAAVFARAFVMPLQDVTRGSGGGLTLGRRLGYLLPQAPECLTGLSSSVGDLLDALNELELVSDEPDASKTDGALENVCLKLAIVAAEILTLGPSLKAQLPEEYIEKTQVDKTFSSRLLDYALAAGIAGLSSPFHAACELLGIVEWRPMSGDGVVTCDWMCGSIVPSRVKLLLTDPGEVFSEVYGWGQDSFDADLLLARLLRLAFALDRPGMWRTPPTQLLEKLGVDVTDLEALPAVAEFPLFSIDEDIDIGLLVHGVPASNASEKPGLAATAVFDAAASGSAELGGNWSIAVESEGEVGTGVSAVLRPGPVLTTVKDSMSDGVPASFVEGRVEALFTYKPEATKDSERPVALLELGEIATITAKAVEIAIGLQLRNKAGELFLGSSVQGGRISVRPGRDDGFLASIVPNGLEADFDVGILWSQRSGLHLSGSASLEVAIPVQRSIGAIRIEEIEVSLQVASELALKALASATCTLGPITATVDGIGAGIRLRYAAGNLGPLSGTAEFVPPRGVGIAIQTEAASGGGFLLLEDGRYSGALEISVYDLAVQAYGLIETKLPDGGYSFLIALSVEFSPAIQLGYGFMLTGIGGLVGINRTVDADVLQKTVRNGTVDHLLFPKDLVKNGPQIIKEVGGLFPSAEGHYVVGPMAKISWLELITGKLGLFIEFPGPRIVLLGTVQMALPSPDQAVVKLNVDVAGILDFPKKQLAIDASLRDSVIASYPISGDMALRLDWGSKPNFALSVGGLNPAYQAPPGFPKLKRVTVDLAGKGSKGPSVSLCGYFAITSNTVQLGAKAEVKASGCGLSLHGWVEFDALFVISPFSFTATLDAGVKVSFHGYGPTIHLHGELKGPSPYHIRGKVSVSILWWDASLDFQKTFGEGSPAVLPDKSGQNVLDDVVAEIQKAECWSSTLPANAYVPVRLVANTKNLEPVGNATLRERITPLGRALGLWKGVKLPSAVTLTLGETTLGGAKLSSLQPVMDSFAPGQFFTMKDSQKLSAQPFEKMQAGSILQHAATTVTPQVGNLDYQEFKLVMGTGTANKIDNPKQVTEEELAAWTEASDSVTARGRRSPSEKYVAPNYVATTTLDDDLYIVAEASAVKKTAVTVITPVPVGKTAAMLALEDYCARNAIARTKYVVIQN